MNLLHLKYAVVIAETSSMTKAAEALFTTQPNLSRAIRELETTLGIQIFKRTSKGICPTAEGEEFLGYARKILSQVDMVEDMYRNNRKSAQRFSISVPRASYISCAFTQFVETLDPGMRAEIFYKETNSQRAIYNILNADYKLGILRYQDVYEKYFQDLLAEKGLASQLICEFQYRLLFSRNHSLAQKPELTLQDLNAYWEIAHADPYVPSLPLSTVRKNEIYDGVDKHIFVFERGSQMDLLSQTQKAFMWVSPIPKRMLDQLGLVQRSCPEPNRRYRDVLIYKKEYSFSDLDRLFVETLCQVQKETWDQAESLEKALV